MRTILVVDDNPGTGNALSILFGMHDIRTRTAASPEGGIEILASERIDLVIADMNFSADTTSGNEGADLFRAIRERYPDLPVILLTAWTNLELAVQLIKAGAADYIAKPWDNAKLLASVENLLELSESTRELQRMQVERRRRREQLALRYDLCGLVFESAAMETVVELAGRVAQSRVPVLISGPNGAGKEGIAAIIHANSTARKGPFVAINCGALPVDLIEAELFGAEAGAFTGAERTRTGRFELAHGGTLLLDEIGNLPLPGQAKLLRVIETGQFEQLGSSKPRSVHVRIVSATNADLPAMIRDGRFREDLYYRLNVIEIKVPPLAARQDDIVPLAEHFLEQTMQLSDEARLALLHHQWPGNVRELRNVIERARLLSRDRVVRAADLNLPLLASQSRAPDSDFPSREMIEAGLRAASGNITHAARQLGLSRQALYRRMERFGIRD